MFDGVASLLSAAGQQARPLAWHLFRLCLALVLPVLLFAAILAWMYVSSERLVFEEAGRDAAIAGAHALDRELTRAVAAGQVLAQSRSIERGDFDRFGYRAQGVREELGLEMRLYDRSGHVVAGTGLPPGTAFPTAPGIGPNDPAWQFSQPHVSDFIAEGAPPAEVRITMPVREAGQVTHLLVLMLPSARIRDIVDATPEPWVSIVTDRQGRILARSSGRQPAVGQSLPAEFLAAIGTTRDGMVAGNALDLGGRSVIAAFSRSSTSGWTVWAVAPVSETGAPLQRSLGFLFVLAALLTVLSSTLATHFAQRIAGSMAAVAAEARRLGQGEAVGPAESDVMEIRDVGLVLAQAAAERLASESQLQEQNRDLQRASKRLADILDALPALVVVLDASGRIAEINEGWRTNPFVGPAGSARVGDDYLAACEPGAAADQGIRATLDGLRAVLARRRVAFETTYSLGIQEDSPRWFHCIAVAHDIDSPAGTGGGALVMHLDITETVRTQQALAEREAQLRLFIERTPAPIAVFDTEMRYLSVSRRFLSDYGLSETDPRALLGRSHYDVFPEIRERWRAIHRRVVIDGETLASNEDPFVRADGRTDWVRWEMTPWRHQDGKIGGAVLFTEVITARKNAEAALRDGEARLRLAIEATELGTWDEDLLTGHVVWNDIAYRILGSAPADGQPTEAYWRERIHPDDQDRVREAYLTARGSGTLFQCEHRIVRPDGEIRWIRPLGRFLQGAFGEALRFVGVFNDITVLKHAGERQERLLQLIEQSNDFIALAEANGQLAYMNRGGRTLIGVDQDADITRLNFTDYIAPGSRTLFETEVLPTVVNKGLWEGEMQLVNRRTGAPLDVHRTTFALRDEQGRLTGFGTVTRDITADKRAEAALAESEARLRSILESVPDGMVLSDETGTIQSFSATAEKLFGWTAAEAVGQSVAILIPAQERGHHDLFMRRYVDSGVSRVIGIGRTVTGQRKDGSTLPLEISLCELRVGGRRLFTAFFRDLTERLATQARLQQMQAELAHVSRLSAAGAMGSALAHELNQPLTAVASAVRAAQRMLAASKITDAPPALKDAMDLAAEQALRAGAIVRRLREFVARGGETDRQVESLPKLIEDASSLALAGARQIGLRARFSVAEDLPLVVADRVQIQQVLVNLMRNATQAMTEEREDGTDRVRRAPELTVSARSVDADTVEISVADTGPGLAPEVADRLFEPFVTTRPGGMGVGLSICKSIIQAHGGRLWAEPNPSGGTIFRFTLQTARLEPIVPARDTDELRD